MEKKNAFEKKETIEVNGAVLTPEVIEQIKSFQEGENEFINSFKEYIAESICFMVKESVDYSGTDKESRKEYLINLSASLSYCRECLTNFQKPK